MNKDNQRKEEIDGIYELLQEVLKEEGYEVCYWHHADKGYRDFEIHLRNQVVKDEKLTIKLLFNHYD